jgi:hypothetical protein
MALESLFRSTHQLEDLPRLVSALGYDAVWAELPEESLVRGPAAIVGRQGEFTWYAVGGAGNGTASTAARALAARGLAAAVIGLDEPGRRLTIAVQDSAPLELSLDAPDPLGLARLSRCAAQPGEAALAAAFRLAEALAGRQVDQRFFAGFQHTLRSVMASLPARIPLPDRHALALLQLTRVLFLYFVEAKGWLAGRPRFLREEVDRCLSARRSLHRDLLEPLFFGTLNRPFAERSTLARRFGAVPFLNGGLFEPHPLERRWRARVPTPVLREAFDALFERFHFTLRAPSGESIAPDMLGRVFERVMEPDERHATGSYYTPAALVDAVLRDALATWLAQHRGEQWPSARRSIDEPDAGTRRALAAVRLLDPAVGSGAFLLGALRLLAGPAVAGPQSAARLRRILGTSLFGVDRNAAAVRLAELRLWLEVVAADPEECPSDVAPLPNLDALVRQGDSLLDPAAGLPLAPPDAGRSAALAELRRGVAGSTGPGKRAALAALRKAERDIAAGALAGAVRSLDESIAEILDVARSPTLFGARQGLDRPARARLAELRVTRRRARERLGALVRTGEVPWFHYATHFADVFARGGFDLVVGNPPWVRAEALAPDQRRYLAERFKWFRGAGSGSAGYRHQPDLSVVFLERSLELLAPRGVVAVLVPAKLATAGYGTTARAELARRTTIAVAADLREDGRAGFDATVYPMALIAALAPPLDGHRVRLSLGAPRPAVPQRSLGPSAWALLADPAREALERIRQAFPPIGARFACHLGVKTGLNRVFLDPEGPVEPELMRWAVRGRDVHAFGVRRVRRLLWPCDARGHALESLPPHAARYLSRHAARLLSRADHVGGKPWTLYRTRPSSAPNRVVWSDLARRLAAAPLIGRTGLDAIPLNTCYLIPTRDSATAIRLTAWLNSTWCRSAAAATADPASGGFFRFNARVVSALPCPPEVPEHPELLDLGRRGMRGELSQESLDDCCAELLALTPGERVSLSELARARTQPGR